MFFLDKISIKLYELTNLPIKKFSNKKYVFVIYRTILHLISSSILLFLSALVSRSFTIVIFTFLVIYILYKEIIFDPKYYKQKPVKGAIDVLSWFIPFILYFLFTS